MNVVGELRLPGLEGALARVEEALAGVTAAADPFLTEVTGHLVSAGGKRLRPALVVATASVGHDRATEVSDDVIQGGLAVELVHLGSLYHDDVMDEAEYRRGVTSVNAKWGNLVAILAGDFLLARASEIAASLGTEVAGLLARTIGQLCEGEVGQLRYAFDPSRPEAAYFSSIGGKTASLMATSARVGAIVSGAPRPWVDALTEYGRALGMAFQIWDDVRDLLCTDARLGKPAGHDMVGGHIHPAGVAGLGRAGHRGRSAGPVGRSSGPAGAGQGPGPGGVDIRGADLDPRGQAMGGTGGLLPGPAAPGRPLRGTAGHARSGGSPPHRRARRPLTRLRPDGATRSAFTEARPNVSQSVYGWRRANGLDAAGR